MRTWVAAFVVLGLSTATCLCEPLNPAEVRVIDGDTIAVRGKTVYLVGFQAPERRGAQCKAERDLGVRAAARIRDLILAGGLDYVPIKCSCPSGVLGKWFCRFGRSCGTLKTNGRDVGDMLVEEGLAVPFLCDETGCPKPPRPWCRSSP